MQMAAKQIECFCCRFFLKRLQLANTVYYIYYFKLKSAHLHYCRKVLGFKGFFVCRWCADKKLHKRIESSCFLISVVLD